MSGRSSETLASRRKIAVARSMENLNVMTFDLVLSGGRVIDPSQSIDRVADVAFTDGRVAAVGDGLAENARAVRDAAGLIVAPGLIDLHTHVYWGGTSLGVDPLLLAKG